MAAAVRFFGPLGNHTGYGNAVANFAKAFSQSSIKTNFSFADNENAKSLLKGLNNWEGKTNLDFYLHCPPYSRHRSKSYQIAYFYWEADRLPRGWGRSLSRINELWVPCELVKLACLRANFRGPIKVVPTPCESWDSKDLVYLKSSFSEKYMIRDDLYKFYAIFQWQNRKGWKTLLNSYYRAFSEEDEVILILKVNPLKLEGDYQKKIKDDILEIKRKLNLKYYPPVYLSTDIVDKKLIRALHNTGDCYVAPHHGEGWGMPIHDAMQACNQIITTKFGGVTEYLDSSSSHIIKHNLGPVRDMGWSPLYGTYQNWAYPSYNDLVRLFQDVYHNHDKYGSKAIKAKKIAQSMDIPSVAKIIRRELIRGR